MCQLGRSGFIKMDGTFRSALPQIEWATIVHEPENKLDRKITYDGDQFLYKKLDEIDDNEENL
jgi:hypothetical protein